MLKRALVCRQYYKPNPRDYIPDIGLPGKRIDNQRIKIRQMAYEAQKDTAWEMWNYEYGLQKPTEPRKILYEQYKLAPSRKSIEEGKQDNKIVLTMGVTTCGIIYTMWLYYCWV